MRCRVTVVVCVCVCVRFVFSYSNELFKKTYGSSQCCKDLIKTCFFFRKTASSQSNRIRIEAIRQLSAILPAFTNTQAYYRRWALVVVEKILADSMGKRANRASELHCD